MLVTSDSGRKADMSQRLPNNREAVAIDLIYMGPIERGRPNPSLLVMARIADAVGSVTQAAE